MDFEHSDSLYMNDLINNTGVRRDAIEDLTKVV